MAEELMTCKAYIDAAEESICFPEAIGLLHKALQLAQNCPQDQHRIPRIYDDLGTAYRNMGKPRYAIKYLTRAIELKGADPWKLFFRGEMYDQLGRQAEARADFEQTLDLWAAGHEWATQPDREQIVQFLVKLNDRSAPQER